MKTRIRHFRKRLGLTQTDLAKRLNTTAATVSRLETADMTVSIDWLEKLAQSLGVTVSQLLDERDSRSQEFLGEVDGGGLVRTTGADLLPALALAGGAPLWIVSVGAAQGAFLRGDLLVCELAHSEDWRAHLNVDCLVEVAGEERRLGRLVEIAQSYWLIPLGARTVPVSAEPSAVAPVVSLIRPSTAYAVRAYPETP